MEQEKLVKYHIEKKDSPASQWDCAPPPLPVVVLFCLSISSL